MVVNKVVEGKGYGYNAASGEYGGMAAMGVPDPTNVTCTALTRAARRRDTPEGGVEFPILETCRIS